MSTHAAKPHVDRKQYLMVFAALTVLTVLEVGVVYVPGINRILLGTALQVISPLLIGRFIDEAIGDADQGTLTVMALLFIAAAFLAQGVSVASTSESARIRGCTFSVRSTSSHGTAA